MQSTGPIDSLTIVLFGHGDLGVPVLARLHAEGIAVQAVVDSEGADGLLTSYAREMEIPTTSLHPRREEQELAAFLEETAHGADVLLSVNFRFIVGNAILDRFRYPLNVHGSLLPKYRGRTPHVWAIINGETETGATLHVMEQGVDTGPIIAQERMPIDPDETGASIRNRFARMYPNLVVDGLRRVAKGLQPMEQDHSGATFFGRRTPEMGLMDFRLPFDKLRDFVRAIAPPYPGAFCYLVNGERSVVESVTLRSDLSMSELPKYSPRLVADAVIVRTDDGIVELHEGKR